MQLNFSVNYIGTLRYQIRAKDGLKKKTCDKRISNYKKVKLDPHLTTCNIKLSQMI